MIPIANPGWKFKKWDKSSNVSLDLENYHSDYQPSTDNGMKIKATDDGETLTAVFEQRYYLVGGEYKNEGGEETDNTTSSGMPGWADTDDYTTPFTVISTSPFEATCTRTLSVSGATDRTYRFMIRDKNNGTSYGNTGSPIAVLDDNNSIECDVANNQIQFYSNGGTSYTFRITDPDEDGYPTVVLERPKQVNFGWKYINIGGELTSGDVGGTVAVTKKSDASAVSNGTWLPYATAVTYTATPETGYSVTWYNTNDYATGQFSTEYTFDHAGTSTGNGFAKFAEVPNSITINKSGEGTITVAGDAFTWGNTTTCGVTTTRALEATAATGYTFTSWSLSADPDFQLDDKSGDDDNTVTLKGKGSGIAGTLTANFTAKTYSVKLNNDHGGEDSENGTATATYDATSLSSITHAKFSGWTLLGYWNTSGVQVANADGSLIANVTGYTDSDGKWINDASETVNLYAHWSRTYTINSNGGTTNGSVTVTYNSADATVTAPVWSGYTLERVYAEAGCTNKLMEANGHLINYDGYVSSSKWTKKDDATLYAKWVKVIYRTGDKTDGDTHHPAAGGSVESYSGSAIPVTIEYRMKVDEIGKWYSLCLPFDVYAVRVWDGEDGRYYDLVPYYRSGDKYYNGHYVIRTPDFKDSDIDSIAISRFGEWVDPPSSAFTPVANTPYTIQWPNRYFENRYVSFFGTSISTWPSTMTPGDAPTDNTVVNVYGNTTMVSGQVPGAYMLDNDYGVGAWLRLEEEEEEEGGRSIPPFECYIRASGATTPLYVAIRPGMTIVDTPTGWDAISNPAEKATKVLIDGQLYIYRDGQMYTVQGTLVK